MSPLAGRWFARMNGIGNEIIVLDLRGAAFDVTPEEARAIHTGAGLRYDQMMVIHDARSPGFDAFARILNNDGSQAGSCGNGTRCVAYILMRGAARETLRLETIAGPLEITRLGEMVFRVDMGAPRLDWSEIPLRHPVADTNFLELSAGPLRRPSAVSMGNPHAVFFVDDAAAADLARLGPELEHDPMFPERANISAAEMRARDHIILRVWERGAGLTKACGSAACAALVAAVRRGLADRRARVSLPGGDLEIEWRQSDGHVLMTGPAELEIEGRLDASIFEGMAS